MNSTEYSLRLQENIPSEEYNNLNLFQIWLINSPEYPLYQKPILYPEINNFLCTAMLLTNLADPECIIVGCNKPITSHVICFWKEVKKRKKINRATMNIYNEMCVLHNNTCYLFEWRTYNTILSTNIGANISNITLFHHVFNAVSVTFPLIIVYNSRYMMKFRRYGNVFHYEKIRVNKYLNECLFITTQIPYKLKIRGNLFECKKNVIISIDSLCDGIIDCPGSEPQDEIGCDCLNTKIYSSKCKFITSKYETKSCSYFYLRTKCNECIRYPVLKHLISTQINGLTNKFHTKSY